VLRLFCSPEASEFKLSGEPRDLEDTKNGDVEPSEWAVLEGQTAHDLVSYVHKLKRNNPHSTDAVMQSLKSYCPPAKAPATRKRKAPSEPSTPVDEDRQHRACSAL
jgi:hypothetical protein